MAAERTVVVIGTLDTKGPETAYLRDRVREGGVGTLVVDAGILGGPDGIAPDVSREEVARAAGTTIEAVRAAGSRGAAVERMMPGVAETCRRLFAAGRCQGVAALGGAEGAVLAAAGMQALPIGVPKVLVTPLASGRRTFGPFVGTRDVLVMHSVVDLLGLNEVSRAVFDQAAAAVAGMARAYRPPARGPRPLLAVTMLGNTTPAVMRMKPALEALGYDALVFHANGVGGRAMEEMIREGRIAAVLDFTLSELTDERVGGFHAAGPDRLEAAGAAGLPQVVVPGCVDFFVQGARGTIPERWRGRASYYQNPSFTLLRASREEMEEVGRTAGRKLSAARGPVAVAIPLGGLSIANRPGGELYDPGADAAFRRAFRAALRPDIPVVEVEAHINDAAFADRVVALFRETAKV
jgi:uncharacterized protein (UPF0261 family)